MTRGARSRRRRRRSPAGAAEGDSSESDGGESSGVNASVRRLLAAAELEENDRLEGCARQLLARLAEVRASSGDAGDIAALCREAHLSCVSEGAAGRVAAGLLDAQRIRAILAPIGWMTRREKDAACRHAEAHFARARGGLWVSAGLARARGRPSSARPPAGAAAQPEGDSSERDGEESGGVNASMRRLLAAAEIEEYERLQGCVRRLFARVAEARASSGGAGDIADLCGLARFLCVGEGAAGRAAAKLFDDLRIREVLAPIDWMTPGEKAAACRLATESFQRVREGLWVCVGLAPA